MLYDNADKAFYRAEYHAVNHNRAVLFSVGTRVFESESSGKLIVELDCAALPCSSETVLNVKIELRSVECAVAFVYDI